jgi:serine protease
LQLSAYGGDTASDQDGDGVPDGLLSTDRNPDGSPGYGLRMGTSMAAPLVSGLAALALSSGTPAGLVRETLAATATDLGVQGYDERYGYGLATGRTATASSPRTYLLALDGGGKVLGWTLVQGDQTFLLGNLPPGEPLTLWAASDLDGDRRLGEGGELVSALLPFVATAGQVSDLPPLGLTPSDGHAPLELADFRP